MEGAGKAANDFLTMTDVQLAGDLLSKDLLYSKILANQVDFYITRAFEISEEMAEPYIGGNATELCANLGISVCFSDKESYFHTKIRSEIIIGKDARAITIYKGASEELSKNSRVLPEEYHISQNKALQMLLMHELFHFLEHETGNHIDEMLPRVVCWKLPLGIKNTSTVRTLSELGAHRFCQVVLKLACYPYLYDKIFARYADTNN